MNVIKKRYPYFLIGFLVIVSVLISIQVYPFKTTADLIVFTITVTSLVISFIAFIISMKTYISIDSVNVITQMEGNVLENENYVTSITSLLIEYNMKESDDLGEAMFSHLEERFAKKSKTAIEFATNLQYFIDLIVLFTSLIHSSNEKQQENINRINRILTLIERRKEALLAISTGNLILIEETVKLIKCVMHYQKLIHTNEYKITSSLLEVRGTMLKNAVTQTVYYNYLGLFYNKKAMYVLRKGLDIKDPDFFEIKTMEKIVKGINQLTHEEVELFTMYLTQSKKCFESALENCNDDVMWEGFIKYNDARSSYFLQLVKTDSNATSWIDLMNEAITARNRLNILISDILDLPYKTHLQEAFIYQEYLARLVKMNIQIAEKKAITDTTEKVKYSAPIYEGIEGDNFIKYPYTGKFDKIAGYQQGILEFLNK